MENSASNEKTSVEQMEVATYNGSNNNYLSSLEIDGINLTSDFNKEKLTYFATVEGLETITVNATAEDSSSNVAITGTNLKSGENKVLISVTAENGDVRYYRIYVTNN
jgi:formate-dependent nitrite reductase cytochrome c552 subunit